MTGRRFPARGHDYGIGRALQEAGRGAQARRRRPHGTAIEDASRGLVDADLGGGVIKQRVARQGEGKSGGFRTIILFRIRERAFFVHGFAKNEQDNIRDDELAAFKMLAAEMMVYDDEALARAVANGALMEVTFHG